MSFDLMEGVVDLVRNYLIANLSTEIAAVNAKHNDGLGITIAAPADNAHYFVAEQSFMPQLPAVFVLGEATRAKAGQGFFLETRNELSIIVIDEDPINDLIRRRMYRHAEAVIRTILRGLNAPALNLTWGDPLANFSPVYSPGGGSGFRQDVQIYFSINVSEQLT